MELVGITDFDSRRDILNECFGRGFFDVWPMPHESFISAVVSGVDGPLSHGDS